MSFEPIFYMSIPQLLRDRTRYQDANIRLVLCFLFIPLRTRHLCFPSCIDEISAGLPFPPPSHFPEGPTYSNAGCRAHHLAGRRFVLPFTGSVWWSHPDSASAGTPLRLFHRRLRAPKVIREKETHNVCDSNSLSWRKGAIICQNGREVVVGEGIDDLSLDFFG